jgi:hypothetical protein
MTETAKWKCIACGLITRRMLRVLSFDMAHRFGWCPCCRGEATWAPVQEEETK